MRIIKLFLALIVCSLSANAQNSILSVKSSSLVEEGNRMMLTMDFSTDDIKNVDWKTCVIIPIIADETRMAEFPAVKFKVGQDAKVSYKKSIEALGWMKGASLLVRRELYNGRNLVSSKTQSLKVKPGQSHTYNSSDSNVEANGFIGSYVMPDADVIDKQNANELYLSLEEMRIIEEITPEMLTLRQLYEVAVSYKNDAGKFHEIMLKSVNLNKTSPVANLNAASSCLERGDITSAGEYLKNVRLEAVEYKNVRGIYEILTGNFNEGIRLLKAAKLAGSAEADSNLTYFFTNYQRIVKASK